MNKHFARIKNYCNASTLADCRTNGERSPTRPAFVIWANSKYCVCVCVSRLSVHQIDLCFCALANLRITQKQKQNKSYVARANSLALCWPFFVALKFSNVCTIIWAVRVKRMRLIWTVCTLFWISPATLHVRAKSILERQTISISIKLRC